MTSKYTCEDCNYESIKLSNYNKHLKTQIHVLKSAGKIGNTSGKKDSQNETVCEFCDKQISYKRHLKRHYQICKKKALVEDKDNKDDIIRRLQLENKTIYKQNKIISKQKAVIEEKYHDLKMNVGSNTTIINNNNNINVNCLNFNYIKNNYTDAYNYEDLMTPGLSKREINHINNYGPSAGCERLLINRCIKDIEKEKRPFHCLDLAREKFAVRTNNRWENDYTGDMILNKAFNQVRDAFKVTKVDDDVVAHYTATQQLYAMDNNRKKIIKFIGQNTLIKNSS